VGEVIINVIIVVCEGRRLRCSESASSWGCAAATAVSTPSLNYLFSFDRLRRVFGELIAVITASVGSKQQLCAVAPAPSSSFRQQINQQNIAIAQYYKEDPSFA
jgi:hypothetical protein